MHSVGQRNQSSFECGMYCKPWHQGSILYMCTLCGSLMWKSKVIVSITFTKFKCCITKGGAYASIKSRPSSEGLKGGLGSRLGLCMLS